MSEYIINIEANDDELFENIANMYSEVQSIGEEIVRCRDCAHWATEARWTGYCIGKEFDADGFCKWGERKDNEE